MVQNTNTQTSIDDLPRIRWACRRGMLELDVILLPFVEKHYGDLTKQKQREFVSLLPEPDPDIYAWLMGHQKPPSHHESIIELIVKKHIDND
ncbi:MAG: succinate dehydrogenase assembly factor 2 family protein [Kangiellaceae bacterium]|nr:succinate dehydrogenase assembly factor 2 family protein [Kangiellaceae bacterium]|tara:strand:- start:7652 stop:7927 length:276 start_codon:yes stop_codon:yes gene_type:complete